MEAAPDTLLQILTDFWSILVSLGALLLSLLNLTLRFAPLIAWICWWSFAVDWDGLWPMIKRGAWLPMSLLAVVATLVWCLADHPADPAAAAQATMNKTIIVATFFAIALICGVLQTYRRPKVAVGAPSELRAELPATTGH